jgi:hypothetical protein
LNIRYFCCVIELSEEKKSHFLILNKTNGNLH